MIVFVFYICRQCVAHDNASPMLSITGMLTYSGGDNMATILQNFFDVFQIFFK